MREIDLEEHADSCNVMIELFNKPYGEVSDTMIVRVTLIQTQPVPSLFPTALANPARLPTLREGLSITSSKRRAKLQVV